MDTAVDAEQRYITPVDYYVILGVSQSATQDEIQEAYRKIARRYGPDSSDSRKSSGATSPFYKAQKAYAVLSDPQTRRAYDQRRAKLGEGAKEALSWTITPSWSQVSTHYAEQVFYLLMEIKPAVVARGGRLPLNLCLVLDRSTSMKGARMDHVKRAAHRLIDQLQDEDILSVVTFDDRPEVVLPSERGVSKAHAKAAVSTIDARGGTEILRGLRAGLSEIAKQHSTQVTSHLILLTDGRTYGDDAACIREAQQAGAYHIGISTMGIGEDWNDELLDEMAAQSGGVSAYVASANQVRTFLEERVRVLGSLFAQGLQVAMRYPDGVKLENVFRAEPYVDRIPSANGEIKLGTLQADSVMSLVLELCVGQEVDDGQPREVPDPLCLQFELTGDVLALNHKKEKLQRDLRIPFADAELALDKTAQALVDKLGKVTLHRMQEHAWEAIERGEITAATRQLKMMATRLFDLGESQLAQAALLEAGRIAQGAQPSQKGRKELKYGTRSLSIAPKENIQYD